MLHGSAGAFTLKSSSEPPIDNFGEKTLAQSCLAVVFPHYLEAIGYKSITTPQEMKSLFPSMINATEIVLKTSEMLPWVKNQPVFIFGESLGGYLSVALSFRHSEVLAVSEVSGGLPQGYLFDRTKTLRVLISHGADDSIVPMQEAETLRKYCLTKGMHVEMNLYQGVGHYFPDQIKSKHLEQTISLFSRSEDVGCP
jgi:predicted esterase